MKRTPAIAIALAVTSTIGAAQANGNMEKARASFLAGDSKTAQAMLETAMAADPRNAAAVYYLGRVKLALHDVDGAVDLLDKAAALNSTSVEYQVWLGRALGEKARAANVFRQPSLVSSSRAALERAVALGPNDIEARKALSEFYAIVPEMLGGGKAKAREQAAAIRRLDPYRGSIQMAWVLADGNDPQGAERELLAALRTYPDSGEIVHALSDIYLQRMNRGADGMQLELAFSARHPADLLGWFYFGRAAAISGLSLDAGEAALKKYLASSPAYGQPTRAAAHFRLGGIYARRGDKPSARREFQSALELDSTLGVVRSALAALGSN